METKGGRTSAVRTLAICAAGFILAYSHNEPAHADDHDVTLETRAHSVAATRDPALRSLEHIATTADARGRVGVIVQVEPGVERGPLRGFVAAQKASISREYRLISAVAIRDLPVAALTGLRNVPGVVSLHEDGVVHANLVESLPLMAADSESIGGLGLSGAGSVVCIIDTGLDKAHPCFAPPVAEYNFVKNHEDAQDDNEHGTHVAGIIACNDPGNPSQRGVAPGASLAIAKVLDSNGSGTTSDVIIAMEWCASIVGADVMNLSLGAGGNMGDCDWDPMAATITRAAELGTVAVAGSGSDAFGNRLSSPACASRAIAVGTVYDTNMGAQNWGICSDATTAADQIACFSNKSPTVDVSAPGSVITSARLGGGYISYSGPSMAGAHVTGLVALLRQQDPTLSAQDIRAILWGHSDDRGAPGFDDAHGHGRVNAARALGERPAIRCQVDGDCDDGNLCTADRCIGGFCFRGSACDDFDACTTDVCEGGECSHVEVATDDGPTCVVGECDSCLGVTYRDPGDTTCNSTCPDAIPIRVGQIIAGSTAAATRDYNNTCSGFSAAGRDVAYRIWLTPGDRVRIELESSVDLSVYVVAEKVGGGDCDITRCYSGMDRNSGAGFEVIPWFTPPTPGWYYLIVDAFGLNVSGSFTLRVSPVCYPDEVGRPCNDHDACTIDDACQTDGTCAGVDVAPTGCTTDADCEDGNVCNGVESCDPVAGCVAGEPLACDDGNACNGVESCDPAQGCVAGVPPQCDDGNVCNGVESCDPVAGCVAGEPLACDDGNACNGVESCDPAQGCVAGVPPQCDDGNVCNGVESCDPVHGCTAGVPLHCDDGLACNGTEFCNPVQGCMAGEPIICDDGDPCTDDLCDEALLMCVFVDNGECGVTVCGNDICEGQGEDCRTCRSDCRCAGPNCERGCCGDGICSRTENARNCPVDCRG